MTQRTPKVSIIGAGQVGSTLAMRVVESSLADVVLLDLLKGPAIGKALDILDASPVTGHEKSIIGTDRYEETASSDIVVITAGFPRRPGMAREELVTKNAAIVRDVSVNIKRYSPRAIVVVVTNPLDAMTYLALKTTGFKKSSVMGMAGVLDGSRFIQFAAAEAKVARSAVETYILGSHGDTMVPLISNTKVDGRPITEVLAKETLDKIVKKTRDRGAEIVSYLGTGSAYFSPSAAVLKMLRAILNDKKEKMAVSAYLEGEYGLADICIGVPCKVGRTGINEILELKLSKEEESAFLRSAKAIKESIALL